MCTDAHKPEYELGGVMLAQMSSSVLRNPHGGRQTVQAAGCLAVVWQCLAVSGPVLELLLGFAALVLAGRSSWLRVLTHDAL